MAIVKIQYSRGRGTIKAHLRYIVHRPGKEQGRLTRELFHHNYLSVTKQEAYDLINNAPRGTIFYKMTINFHPLKEDRYKDLDLQYISSLTVREMQTRLGRIVPFFATIHDGHAKTTLRHIHAICLVQGRLSKEDFGKLKTLWQTVTEEVRLQRSIRDRVLERQQTRFLAQAQVLYRYSPSSERHRYWHHAYRSQKRKWRQKSIPLQPGCYHCGYGQLSGIPAVYEFCPCCHRPLTMKKMLRLELGRSL
jgi:hypothetical protein